VHEVDELGERFWAWRARQQPRTRDDIPRLDRPAGWRPEVDPALAGRRREELTAFQAELRRIRPDQVADRVDHRLLRSALARVEWESDILRVRSIPRFWIDQALGPVFDALLRPGVDAGRVAEVVRLLRAVPATLAHAPQALAQPAREFAELAVAELDGIADRIAACTQALSQIAGIDPAAEAELGSAAAQASAALQPFGERLAAVRRFYAGHGLLSQPEWLRHYLTRPMPAYLEPLRFLGVTDDLTGPGRLTEDGVSYVPPPGPELPYFYAANARDPRAGILHEGVHYQQLALAWRHPRPVRRHYYDSGANEGIAFYNEEMMLASGLLDDAPHTQAAMCNFMRLRALRVTVDVGLATGALSIAAAAGDLASRVPMDVATAREEAAFFAETPGQALTYQIGKTQLIGLIADAVRLRGADLDLQWLHDQVWVNGNVPIALLRWELLGLTDELAALDTDPG
jgi:hypothetical protein